MFCYGYRLPQTQDIPYQPYDIQSFFVKHDCFLATYPIAGILPSDIIRKYCFANNVNPKWVLARMQTERCLISGKVDGNYFIIPGQRKRLKIVLRECCGYGLSWSYNGHKLNPKQYLGFVNQVSHCAKFMSVNLKTRGIKQALRHYDPTVNKYDGVELFCNVWYSLFQEKK